METVNGKVYEKLMLGDMIFVSASKNLNSSVNKAGQRLMSGLGPEDGFMPTHVAIATGFNYVVLHATKGFTKHRGVHYSSLMDFIDNKNYSKNIFVYRNKPLENLLKDDSNKEAFNNLLKKYWGQGYSTLGTIIRRSIQGRKYCSELAVDFLKSLKVVNQAINSAKTYPIELLNDYKNIDEWRLIDPGFSDLLNIKFFEEQYNNALKTKNPVVISSRQANLDNCKQQIEMLKAEDISLASFFNSSEDLNVIIKGMQDKMEKDKKQLKEMIRILNEKTDNLIKK